MTAPTDPAAQAARVVHAIEAGRTRGDRVCRVPGADPDTARQALADCLILAEDEVQARQIDYVRAIATRDRIRERVAEGDVTAVRKPVTEKGT